MHEAEKLRSYIPNSPTYKFVDGSLIFVALTIPMKEVYNFSLKLYSS